MVSSPAALAALAALDALDASTRRLLDTVRGLDTSSYAAASLLPGWSRAHVVAHLVLNAEGLAAAVRGAARGEPVPMYRSEAARDDDIAALATAPSAALALRLEQAATDLAAALEALPADRHDAVVERSPGSPRTFTAGEVTAMRRTEVEVHHADLDAGWTAADWPDDFALAVVDRLASRTSATLVATDVGRTWQGDGRGPTVSGPAGHLGWWLTGRAAGDRLSCDGELPRIEAW